MRLHRAVLSSLLFVALVPGTVVALVPWLLTHWRMPEPFLGTVATRFAGGILIAAAVPVLLEAIFRFAWQGRGTPAPVLPTEHLVVTGTYRFVRNPMYVAVLSALVGQALLFASLKVLVYAACVAAAFHAFVMIYEEPTLRRNYGASYEQYCRAVRRWLPRLTPWSPP